MKSKINEILKQSFTNEFNNAKKMVDAECKQNAFTKVYYTDLSNGLSFVRQFANN